jgi:hypothetical protein
VDYQVQMVPQVETWLAETRDRDPATADRIDEAIAALRTDGENVGPPLVVLVDDEVGHGRAASMPGRRTGVRRRGLPVHVRQIWGSHVASNLRRRLLGRTGFWIARPALDTAFQQQRLMFMRVRRAIGDVAAPRLRLEQQIKQLEQQSGAPGGQSRPQMEAGQADATDRLAWLRRRHAELLAKEERLYAVSRPLQAAIEAFRAGQEAIEAAYAAADKAAEAVSAEVTRTTGADAEGGGPTPGEADNADSSGPAQTGFRLRELRPDAPSSANTRIMFTVDPPDAVVLLAAGTENDWLDIGYDEIIELCHIRYERERSTR